MEQARTGRPRLVCSAECRKLRRRVDREEDCAICGKALTQATTGRARKTCSDRCRQQKRRQNYRTWIDPRRHQKELRKAEREVRKIEKACGGPGSLDIPTPGYEWLTLRKRLLIRFQRGEEAPFCQICGKPYINDTPRRRPACRGKCSEKWLRRMQRVRQSIEMHRGQYDPRIDVRMRLGLPVETCKHCEKPFCIYHPRQIYCSDQCNKVAWYARHPKRTCKWCGEKFRGTRETCSRRCQSNHDYHHKVHCARCAEVVKPGCEIPPNADTRLPRRQRGSRWEKQPVVFCSGRCRDALGWSPSYKFCEECGELYWPETPNKQNRQKYCCKACGEKARDRQHRRARHAALPPLRCGVCGEDFPRRFGKGSKDAYCSRPCRLAARAASQRAYTARKKGLLLGIPVGMVREPERVTVSS